MFDLKHILSLIVEKERKAITPKEFAKRMDCDYNYLMLRSKKQKCTPGFLALISVTFGISMDELIPKK